jgi:hypothetical protein
MSDTQQVTFMETYFSLKASIVIAAILTVPMAQAGSWTSPIWYTPGA